MKKAITTKCSHFGEDELDGTLGWCKKEKRWISLCNLQNWCPLPDAFRCINEEAT